MILISKAKSTTKFFGHNKLEICFPEIISRAPGCQFKILIDVEPDFTTKALTKCSNMPTSTEACFQIPSVVLFKVQFKHIGYQNYNH